MAVFQKTAQAEEDLIDIWLYIAQDNPGAANQLLDTFQEKDSAAGRRGPSGKG